MASLRRLLYNTQAAFERINYLVTYELAHEMVSSIAYSKDLSVTLDEIYHNFFESEDSSAEGLREYLNTEFPLIYVPINTPLVKLYEDTTARTGEAIEEYRSDYPSLFRVLISVNRTFQHIEYNNKRAVREEEIWRSAIRGVYDEYRPRIDSVEEFKVVLVQVFVGSLEQRRKDHHQKDIDDVLKISKMVLGAYLSMSDRELLSIRRKEKRVSYIPTESTQKTSEDLEEAEKGLKWILSELDLTRYHDATRDFYHRNSG